MWQVEAQCRHCPRASSNTLKVVFKAAAINAAISHDAFPASWKRNFCQGLSVNQEEFLLGDMPTTLLMPLFFMLVSFIICSRGIVTVLPFSMTTSPRRIVPGRIQDVSDVLDASRGSADLMKFSETSPLLKCSRPERWSVGNFSGSPSTRATPKETRFLEKPCHAIKLPVWDSSSR